MKTLKHLLIDSVRENPLWEDFVQILDDQNKKDILGPIQQLLSIRDVSNVEDPEIVKMAIRQQGLALTDEMINLNLEKLHQLYRFLPLFHETSGTPRYPKFIEFLLDRNVFVKRLWTADYQNFSEKPLGPKIIDGGEWYPTTHISVTIAGANLSDYFDLTVLSKDVERLKALGYTDEEINAVYGTSVENSNDGYLKQSVLESRVIDLFYKFAPIEEVIDQLVLSVVTNANVYIGSALAYNNKDYISLRDDGIQTVRFPSNLEFIGGIERKLTGNIVWTNGAESSVDMKITFRGGEEFIESQRPSHILFHDPEQPQAIPVTIEAMGRRKDVTIQLTPSYALPIPAKIEIVAPANIPAQNIIPVAVNGIVNGEPKRIQDLDSVIWHAEDPKVVFADNRLYAPKTVETINTVIHAEYTDRNGTTHVDSQQISIEPISVPLELEDIRINITDDQIVQGTYQNINAELVFNDGSTQPVEPIWEAMSSSVTISPDQVMYSSVVYKDFKFTLKATGSALGKTITKEVVIDSVFPKIDIFEIEIIGQDEVIGGERHQLRCIAHWADVDQIVEYQAGNKTQEEILRFTTEVDAVWRNVGVYNSITSYEVELSKEGLMDVPQVNRSEVTHISAMVINENSHSIETLKTITLKPRNNRIEYLDIVMQGSLHQDNTALIRTIANWTDGTQTELYPDELGYTLDYSSTLAETGNSSPYLVMSVDNPSIIEYHGIDTGIATIRSRVIYDHVLPNGDIEQQLIDQEHLLNLIPKVYLTNAIEVVAPEGHLADKLKWVLSEQGRMFVRTTVTMEDGSELDIMPNWEYEVLAPQDDEHEYLDILSETFTIEQMIKILTNKSPLELYMDITTELSSVADYAELTTDDTTGELLISYRSNSEEGSIDIPVSGITDLNVIYNHDALFGYEEFKGLKTFQDTEKELVRSLIQSTKVNEQVEIRLTGSFFREEELIDLTLTDRPIRPHDVILGYKLKGPMEFLATVPAVSYAMYANYDEDGEEYGVSTDWSIEILNKRQVLEDLDLLKDLPNVETVSDEELDRIYPDNILVDIDDNGYVYPKHNVNMALRVTAKYDDGLTQLSDYLDVNMVRANTNLKSLRIIGPTEFSDTDTNVIVDNIDGLDVKAHVPYTAVLERHDGTLEAADLSLWEMKINPKRPGQRPININVGEDTGKLYIVPQIEDQSIILSARYEEYADDVLETVSTQLPVEIFADKMPVSIEVDEIGGAAPFAARSFAPLSVGIVKDDSKRLLTATVTHADGTTSAATFAEWVIVDGPIGVKIDNTGTLTIPQLVEDANVTVGIKYSQGSTSVEATYTIPIVSESALEQLGIAGHSNVRDDSSIQLEAVIFRALDVTEDYQDKPFDPNLCEVQECVTERCTWLVVTDDERATIEPTTGKLHLELFLEHTDIVVKAIFEEQGQSVETEYTIHVKSSMPKYGLGPYGLSTQEDLYQYVNIPINNMKQGGSFTLRTNEDEGLTGYAYLAHRKDIGSAVISEADGRTQHGGWNGAGWSQASENYETEQELLNILEDEGSGPIEVEVSYDNLTETWLLFRCNKPDFHLGRFAYYYRKPEPVPIPVLLNLIGPDQMDEQTTETYHLEVTMDNGDVEVVPFTSFECEDIALVPDAETGEATAGDIIVFRDVELVGTYTVGNITLTATKTVRIIAQILPESMEIVGPVVVDEESTTAYLYRVTMNNEDVKTVTALTSDATVGTLDVDGNFIAPSVTSSTPSTLSANYEELGVTVDATLDIIINNSNNLPTGLVITGPTELNEAGPSGQLEATVSFEDGTTQVVTTTCDWSALTGNSDTTIDSVGLVTPATVITTDKVFTVRASFTTLGVEVFDTHEILIKNVNKELTGITISGPTQVDEGEESITLSAEAEFDDGSTEIVTDQCSWGIITGGAYASNLEEVITSVQNVTQNRNVTIQASFTYNTNTLDDTHIVTVINKYSLPTSVEIVGPTDATDNGPNISLDAVLDREDGSTETVTLSAFGTWSISNNAANGSVASDGIFTPGNVTQPETVTVRFEYTEFGVTVSDIHSINISWVAPTPIGYEIVPLPNDEIEANTPHQFLLRTLFSDGTHQDATSNKWTGGVPPVDSQGNTSNPYAGAGTWPQPAQARIKPFNHAEITYNYNIVPRPTTPRDADLSNLPTSIPQYSTLHIGQLVDVTLEDGSVVKLDDIESTFSSSSHGNGYGVNSSKEIYSNKVPSTGGNTVTIDLKMSNEGVMLQKSFTIDIVY